MSDDAKNLRAALLIIPDDADRWKVYADWLDETGSESQAAHAREVARLLDNDDTLPTRISVLAFSVPEWDPEYKSMCDKIVESEFEQLISDRSDHIIDSEEISGVHRRNQRMRMLGGCYRSGGNSVDVESKLLLSHSLLPATK